ncbi:hypothetical protein ACEPAI_3363 [Sanghuangporus weigelae]
MSSGKQGRRFRRKLGLGVKRSRKDTATQGTGAKFVKESNHRETYPAQRKPVVDSRTTDVPRVTRTPLGSLDNKVRGDLLSCLEHMLTFRKKVQMDPTFRLRPPSGTGGTGRRPVNINIGKKRAVEGKQTRDELDLANAQLAVPAKAHGRQVGFDDERPSESSTESPPSRNAASSESAKVDVKRQDLTDETASKTSSNEDDYQDARDVLNTKTGDWTREEAESDGDESEFRSSSTTASEEDEEILVPQTTRKGRVRLEARPQNVGNTDSQPETRNLNAGCTHFLCVEKPVLTGQSNDIQNVVRSAFPWGACMLLRNGVCTNVTLQKMAQESLECAANVNKEEPISKVVLRDKCACIKAMTQLVRKRIYEQRRSMIRAARDVVELYKLDTEDSQCSAEKLTTNLRYIYKSPSADETPVTDAYHHPAITQLLKELVFSGTTRKPSMYARCPAFFENQNLWKEEISVPILASICSLLYYVIKTYNRVKNIPSDQDIVATRLEYDIHIDNLKVLEKKNKKYFHELMQKHLRSARKEDGVALGRNSTKSAISWNDLPSDDVLEDY